MRMLDEGFDMEEEDVADYIEESVVLVDDCKILWREDRPISHFKNDIGHKIFIGRAAGKEAGSVFKKHSDRSYKAVKIGHKRYKYHRVVWFLYYGVWPKGQIDHIDGNGLNNHISNLRDVDQGTNLRNVKRKTTNTSGVTGVYYHKKTMKWRACARANNNYYYLGCYKDFGDAVKARKDFEEGTDFYGPSHGK